MTNGQVVRYHHITLRVSNAMQAACWYCTHFGFKPLAFKPSNEESNFSIHVVRLNSVVFALEEWSGGTLGDKDDTRNSAMGEHLIRHGDAVADVSFEVDNLEVILSIGDTTHTLLEGCGSYSGHFLPGFLASPLLESLPPLLSLLPPLDDFVSHIDHVAANSYSLDETSDWYQKTLDFHRFWTSDSIIVDTGKSALRIGSFASPGASDAKLVISEPFISCGSGSGTSQIQEYLTYNSGSGVQHIAFYTSDIISTVRTLKERGAEFLNVPDTYYDLLSDRFKTCQIEMDEDVSLLKKYKILVDCDERGYLLQIFTKPVQDRPTLFLEFIQRNRHQGFGAGNIKSLFKAIELDQEARGNLNKC